MRKRKKVNSRSPIKADVLSLKKMLPRKGKGCTLYNKDIFFKRVKAPQTIDEDSFYTHTNKQRLYKFYGKFMYDLFEVMMFDFIQGDIIIFDKKRGLKFFMYMEKAPNSLIAGKPLSDCVVRKIPHLDFSKLDYSFPRVMMELGYKDKPAAFFKMPAHLYLLLIDEMYKGKRYIKSSRENSTPIDYLHNVIYKSKKWLEKRNT